MKQLSLETGLNERTIWKWLGGGLVSRGSTVLLDQTVRARGDLWGHLPQEIVDRVAGVDGSGPEAA